MIKRIICIAAAFFVSLSAVGQFGHLTHLAGWFKAPAVAIKKLQITFDGYDDAGTLSDFPVLVKLSTNITGFSYADFISGNGYDLRFYRGSSTNELDYEFEEWDTDGTSWIWIEADSFSDGEVIWGYWGDSDYGQQASLTNGETWNSDFVGVWHMDDTIEGASSNVADGSTYENDGISTNTVSTNGIALRALYFSEDACEVKIANASSMKPTTAITMEAWSYRTADDNNADIFLCYPYEDGTHTSPYFEYSIHALDNDPPQKQRAYINGLIGNATDGLALSNWYHVVSAWANDGADTIVDYRDGVQTNSKVITDGDIVYNNPNNNIYFGRNGGNGECVVGYLDEIRISQVKRSSNWIWTTWITIASNDTVNSYSTVSNATYYPPDEPPPVDDVYRMKIDFAGATSAGTVTNFPALVVLSTNLTGFSYDDFESANGYDLRFKDSDNTTILDYEFDEWNTGGTSYVWVEIPVLTNDHFIYAHWGDEDDTTQQAYTTNGATWESNFKAVWHLNEAGGTTDADHWKDSTTNTNHLTASTNTMVSDTGIVGKGVYGPDGNDNYLNRETGINLQNTNISMSCFLERRTTGNRDCILSYGNSDGADQSMLSIDASKYIDYETADTDPTVYETTGVWHRAVGIHDEVADEDKVYVDGVLNDVVGSSAGQDSDGRMRLFSQSDSPSWGFNAVLDEVRVSDIERSSNWIWSVWFNAASNDSFQTYNTVEENP